MRLELTPWMISMGYVILAVAVAATTNAVSAKWGEQVSTTWNTPWLWLMLALSPFVFITFGLASGRMGLALGSANVDSLLTVVTIMIGLIVFREWRALSMYQYIGVGLIIVGIVFTQIPRSTPIF